MPRSAGTRLKHGSPTTGRGQASEYATLSAQQAETYKAVYGDPSGPDLRLRSLLRSAPVGVRLGWDAARWRLVAVSVLEAMTGLGAFAQLLGGYTVITRVVDHAPGGGDMARVIPALALVLGATAVVGVAGAIADAQQPLLAVLLERHGFDRTCRVVIAAPMADMEDPAFHDRVRRMVLGGLVQSGKMATGIVTLAGGVLGAVGVALSLFIVAPLLLLAGALAALPLLVAGLRNARSRFRARLTMVPSERERAYVRELLTQPPAAKEVRAFTLGPFLQARNDQLSDVVQGLTRRNAKENLRRDLTGRLLSGLVTAATIAVLVWFVTSERLSLAQAAAGALGLQLLAGRLQAVVSGLVGLADGALFVHDFTAFLAQGEVQEARAATRRRASPTRVEPFRRLDVEAVSFRYPGTSRFALRDVSLTIESGQVVAVVGENGSGKTTLAKLLCALYEPSEGRLLWDGVDVAGVDPDVVRRQVAVIFQDFMQYHLRARDNVAMGRPERIDDFSAIVAAATRVDAAGFLGALPHGWETRFGREFDEGFELSTGEWQRVALARAFFRDAPFIVLDEPSAALDPRAEHELFEAIRQLAAGRTVLVISHRFSSVRNADRIFVMHEGRLVEEGNHEQLMALDGQYAELFRLQSEAFLYSS